MHERAIKALAQIIDSPGGMLWMKRENGRYELDETWNMSSINAREPADSSFIRFLEEQQFVISLDEFREEPEAYTRLAALEIPDWLLNIDEAWLVSPLMLNDSLLGFVVLRRSRSYKHYFNWKTVICLKQRVGKPPVIFLSMR